MELTKRGEYTHFYNKKKKIEGLLVNFTGTDDDLESISLNKIDTSKFTRGFIKVRFVTRDHYFVEGQYYFVVESYEIMVEDHKIVENEHRTFIMVPYYPGSPSGTLTEGIYDRTQLSYLSFMNKFK